MPIANGNWKMEGNLNIPKQNNLFCSTESHKAYNKLKNSDCVIDPDTLIQVHQVEKDF